MFEQKRNKTMKKLVKSGLIIFTSITLFTGCDVVNEALSTLGGNSGTTESGLSNDEVISGLKGALDVGIKNATGLTSKTDGFLKNPEIKLPFPADAQKIKDNAVKLGLSSQIVKIEETLNRAAEEASKEATPIFVNSIKNMSISDAMGLLNGGDGSATRFLKNTTTAELKAAFKPKVEAAISKVKLTEYWEPVVSKYNMSTTFTGEEKINTDLTDYVLTMAIDGLFKMVEKEENKIRKDPLARVTDILKKVFGSLK